MLDRPIYGCVALRNGGRPAIHVLDLAFWEHLGVVELPSWPGPIAMTIWHLNDPATYRRSASDALRLKSESVQNCLKDCRPISGRGYQFA